MDELRAEVITTKSVAEIVRDSDINIVRKFILRLLMPKELFYAPATELAKLQRGCKIASMSIIVDQSGVGLDNG